ncbi:hypothetical protein ACTFIW_005361 [Dictyostelium discoideum]
MKKIFLFIIFLIILIIKSSNCDRLVFVGDTNNQQSFLNKTNWYPEKVPTKDDLLLSNGGNLLIDYDDICSSEYFTINNGSFYLYGQYSVFDSMDINRGSFIMGNGALLNVNNSINVKNNFEISSILYPTLKNTTISTNNFIIGGFLNIYQKSNLFLNCNKLEINNNGFINVGNNSKINLNGGLIMKDKSQIYLNNSNIEINGGDAMLMNQSLFNTMNNLNLFISGSLQLNDDSQFLLFDNNEMTINGDLILNGNSKLSVNDKSELSIYGDLKINGDSKFEITGMESIINIGNDFYSSINSKFLIEKSNFNSWGGVEFNGEINFNSCDFSSHKSTIFNSDIVGIITDSVFKSHGSLTINNNNNNKSSLRIQNSIIYSYDDLIINGEFQTNFTTVYIEGGNTILQNSSYINLNDSIFIINKGNLIIHPNSFINLENSKIILDNGIVKTLGNLYLNNNSTFEINQNGIYNLSSGGIYYTNDTNIKSNNITLKNNGIFNIDNDNVEINISFINNGGGNSNGNGNGNGDSNGGSGSGDGSDSITQLNINNHTIYIYEFRNENGSELNLNGGTLSSDNSIQLNGGSIKGNGNINSTIIQNSGEFGSSFSINNFNIIGNFIQSNDSSSKIIILIDSLNSFSTINISKLADINGIVIIKINENLLNNSNTSSSSSSSSNEKTILKIVNFGSKSSNSFGNIKFATYDSKGNEKELSSSSPCVDARVSSTSFSVLIDVNDCFPNDNKVNSLSIGAIVGIVIACAIIAIVIMSIIHYRERARFLGMLAKAKLSKISKKLSRK